MKKYADNTTKNTSNTAFFVTAAVICFLLSSSVIPFLGASASGIKPDLLLCFCCLLPKFMPRNISCIFALTLGFLSDLFINPALHFSPLLYLASVLITPLFYFGFNRVGTVTASVCALCSLALAGFVRVFAVFISAGGSLKELIFHITLPELLVNFAFTLLTGYLLKLLCSRFCRG